MKLIEIETEDKVRVNDLKKDIIDIQSRILGSDSKDEKESLKAEIEDKKSQIQSIRDAADTGAASGGN